MGPDPGGEQDAETVSLCDLDQGPAPVATTRVRGDLLGRYVIVDFIDRGGMGEVYKAFDPELNRPLALKLVSIDHTRRTEGHQARLLREAQALAQLAHPNIVAVHDVGTYKDGVFMAMEFVEGITLKTYLTTPHPRAEVLAVLRDAGAGLAYAHKVGITHRDIKPANVLLGTDGRVRVIDFGIARTFVDESTPFHTLTPPSAQPRPDVASPLTEVGKVLGTPRYMAPEQYDHGAATAQSDQWSFCVLLFEGLYGASPFPGSGRDEVRDKARRGAIERPAQHDVPAWLDQIVCRGLAPAPADRFPSMDALLAALADDPAIARAARRTRRQRVLAIGLLAAMGVTTGWVLLREDSAPPALCARPTAMLAGAWDPAVRARIAARFHASGRSYADDQAARVGDILDRYGATWLDARTDACLATNVRHEHSPHVLDLRMQCLDRRLAELHELTRLFATGDDVVDRSVQAAATLASPASCSATHVLSTTIAPPKDPTAEAAVHALRDELARADALTKAGKYKEALAVVAPLVERSRAVGYLPVQAEIAEIASVLQERLSDAGAARTSALAAVELASASGAEDTLVKAYTDLVLVVGIDQQHVADAEMFAGFADAALTHLGDDPELRLRLTHDVGIVYLSNDDSHRAIAPLEKAHQLAVSLYGPDHVEVARVLNNLGVAAQLAGDYPRARRAYADAFEIFRRGLGPDHPAMGAAYVNLGVADFLIKDLANAELHYEAGVRILETTLGPTHPRVATTVANLGEVALAREDFAHARALYARARTILEGAAPAHASELGEVLNHEGAAELGLAHPALAAPLFERALALCANAACVGDNGDARADSYFGLARAAWTEPAGRDRARTLARKAIATRAGETQASSLASRATYQAWLDAHAATR